MISADEHKEMVRRFLAAVSFADGDCKELILSIRSGDLSKTELMKLTARAKEKGMDVESFVRQTLVEGAEKQSKPSFKNFEPKTDDFLTSDQARAYKYAMRSARIFEVPTEAMKTLFGEIQEAAERDLYALLRIRHGEEAEKEVRRFHKYVVAVAEKQGIFPDIPAKEQIPPQYQRASELLAETYDTISNLPMELPEFPDKRPFNSCLFMAPQIKAFSKDMLDIPFGIEGERHFLGLLIAPQICCFIVFIESNSFIDMRPVLIRWEDQWVGAGKMVGPRTTDTFVRLVNDFKRIVEERSAVNNRALLDKLRKQRSKLVMVVPPPFYVVHLSTQIVKEHRKSLLPSRPRQWQHRWSVRGHTMMRFRRGKLPLVPKLEKILLARKYKIWTLDSPDPETMLEMGRRNIAPPRVGEWLATLVRWRKDSVKGPQDKPFIPSAHRVSGAGDSGGRN